MEKENKKTNEEKEPVQIANADSKSTKLMNAFMTRSVVPASTGDIVRGRVIAIEPSSIFVDLPPFGTGLIYGREYINARDIIKKVSIGDEVTATVVEAENADGYIELSLKEARQALIWGDAEKAIQEKLTFTIPVKDANKGGLILEWQGIQGFIPASQLKTEHYPRVDGGDKDKILGELQKLVGQDLVVSIIAANPQEGKLIFSEKDPEQKDKEEIVGKYGVGDIVEGDVTGIVDFGIFVKIEEGLEGLAHISELDWALVEDPRKLFEVGQKLKAKVIEIKNGQISLSVKQLQENPWVGAEKKFAKGDEVQAVVIKYNQHGALASIEEGVAGLVHISEFDSQEQLQKSLELGKTYPFKINLFEPKGQRMTLSYTGPKAE